MVEFSRSTTDQHTTALDDGQHSSHELQSLEKVPNATTIKPSWRSLFAFTRREHWPPLLCALFATLLSGLIKPALSIFYGKIFATLTQFGGGKQSGKETLHEISTWCLAVTALGIGAWLAEGGLMTMWIVYGELQAMSVRQEIFATMLDKDLEWYDSREEGIGAFLIRLQTQIRELQLAASQPVGLLLFQFVATLASLGVALFFSWNLSLVIIATFPLAAILLWLISRGLTPAIEAQKRELSRATKYANTALTAIDTVKAFNAQDQEVWQYYSTINKITIHYLKQARANAMQFGATKSLVVGIFVQGFWYGIYLVNRGLNPGNVVTTFYSCLTAIQALEVMLPQILVLTKGMSGGATLKHIMNQIQYGVKSMDMGGMLRPDSCSGDIEMNDITFAYPANPQQLVLNKTSFFFPAGETTFVVGRSGSGKSTIGNILMKYYEKRSGEVLIDGRPIEELSVDWLRKNITLVQQHGVLFNETILQNIAFGRRDDPTREDIELAAKTGCLEETIHGMPEGFDTIVGSNGRSLSGGQIQRVAIARARLRDAPILILDESTSELDLRGRVKVIKAIREWRHGKTTIIITHDMSQILDDDYVYVLEDTHVVQEGYRKKLAEKQHGTFASILITENSKPSTEIPQGFSSIHPGDDSRRHWKYISNALRRKGANSEGSYIMQAPHRMSLGVGISHASDLRTHSIWASPIILEGPQTVPSRRWSGTLNAFPKLPTPPSSTCDSNTKEFIPGTATTESGYQNPRSSNLLSEPVGTEAVRPIPLPSETRGGAEKAPTPLVKILGTVWPVLDYKQRSILIMGFVAAFLAAAGTPAFAWVLAQLFTTFYLDMNQLAEARKWALILLGVAIADGLATFSTHYALEYCGQCWINALRLEALKCILAQPKSWFDMEANSPSRLNDVLDRNAEEMRNLVGRFAGLVFIVAIMLGISLVWSFIISWQLTLVIIACGPIFYLVTVIFHWVTKKWEEKCNRSADLTSSIFTETFANIRVVRALTLENYFGRKYRRAATAAYQVGRKRAAYTGLLFGLLDSAVLFIFALAYFYGTVLVTNGTRTVSDIFKVVNLLVLGLSNASTMISMIPQLSSSCATATQMLYLADLSKNESIESKGTSRLSSPFPVQMNNLSFTYANQTNKTLDNISLTIEPGTCTTIVGHSGSGKSTIIALLQGLYPPDIQLHGPPALTYNNRSILECNITALRSFLSVVPQSPLLFPTTVLENIVYGLPENSPLRNPKAVEHAASESGIHDFIVSLPQGYNTAIGDGGQGVSGGQAQRIAIARALVRRPKILIMDEATSALDSESAEKVKRCICGLISRGVAVVMITHNIEMMRNADKIVVLDHGKIVEIGAFEELLGRKSALATLLGEEGNGKRGIVRAQES